MSNPKNRSRRLPAPSGASERNPSASARNLSHTRTPARQDAGPRTEPHRVTLDALYQAAQLVRTIRARTAAGGGEPDAPAGPPRLDEHGGANNAGPRPG